MRIIRSACIVLGLLILLIALYPGPADTAPGIKGATEVNSACSDILRGNGNFREELTYSIRWGIISAGTAILRLTPSREKSGNEIYRIESLASSNKFIDVFFKVRDRTESLVDRYFKRSLFYSKIQREGGFARDEFLEYDIEDGIGLLFRDGKLKSCLRLPEEYQDPVSGLYSFRKIEAEPGMTIGMYATDGRRLMIVKGTVLGTEELEVPAGRFDCLKVELFPRTLEGPFKMKKHGRIFIWFTDDECRLPVKMSTEIIIGSVDTILQKVDYQPVTP